MRSTHSNIPLPTRSYACLCYGVSPQYPRSRSQLVAAACGSDRRSHRHPTAITRSSASRRSAELTSSIKVTFTSQHRRQQLRHRARRGRDAARSPRSTTCPAPATAGHGDVHRHRPQSRTRCIAIASSPSSAVSDVGAVERSDGHHAGTSATASPTSRPTSPRAARSIADTAYTLKGFIHVTNGATLTIQPGTKIKGDFNTLGSSLFIMRGAKIRPSARPTRRSSSRRRAPPASASRVTGAV